MTQITVGNITSFIRNYETVNSVKVWNIYIWADLMGSFYRYRLATRNGIFGFQGESGERLETPGMVVAINQLILECKKIEATSSDAPQMRHISESELEQFKLSLDRCNYIRELYKNCNSKMGEKIMVVATVNGQGDVQTGQVHAFFNNDVEPRVQVYFGQSGNVISANQILSVFKVVPCKGIEGLKNF